MGGGDTRQWVRWLREHLAASYWTAPSFMVLTAVGMAFAAAAADRAVRPGPSPSFWGVDLDAGLILSTLAGSMITVAALVFSITMVVLTLTAQQFGHRLVRGVLNDRSSQVVLGFFLATFVYSLLALALLERGGDASVSVPAVTVGLALALGVGGVGFLIHYVAHVTVMIRADSVLAAAEREFREVQTALRRACEDAKAEQTAVPGLSAWADEGPLRDVVATDSGYVQLVRVDRLAQIGMRHMVRIDLLARPGDFVHAGEVVAKVDDCEDARQVEVSVARALVLGAERTRAQDIRLSLYRLQEAALRALSPGINDAHTAVSAVARIRSCLLYAAEEHAGGYHDRRLDADGHLLVRLAPVTFEQMTSETLAPLIAPAAASADVLMEILKTVSALEGVVAGQGERIGLQVLVQSVQEIADGLKPAADAARARGACAALLGRLS